MSEPVQGQSIEMGPVRQLKWRIKFMGVRLRRLLPSLVWNGDEIDVTVTITDLAEIPSGLTNVWKAQEALSNLGITFDTGFGGGGRDWEWDYSLKGPIKIKFRRRAKEPEKRRVKPSPKLVVDNSGAA